MGSRRGLVPRPSARTTLSLPSSSVSSLAASDSEAGWTASQWISITAPTSFSLMAKSQRSRLPVPALHRGAGGAAPLYLAHGAHELLADVEVPAVSASRPRAAVLRLVVARDLDGHLAREEQVLFLERCPVGLGHRHRRQGEVEH